MTSQLDEIYDLVRHGPSAMNCQPLRITFIRSAEAKARLLPLLSPGNRAKSESAPVIAVLAADTTFHEHLTRATPLLPNAQDMFTAHDAQFPRNPRLEFEEAVSIR